MNRAFTLAETLITLGIIGVVASLTLPNIVQKYQKYATVNKLKNSYTTIYNAIEMAKSDYGTNINQWDIPVSADTKVTSDYFAEKYMIPYLKIVKDCKPYIPRECLPTNMSHARVFILANGTIISVYVAHDDEDLRAQISMYLNGYKKQNPARDKFLVELGGGSGSYTSADKNKFLPYGYRAGEPRTNYTSIDGTDCSKTGNKSRCFALIMHDGWKIADDYPW